MPNNKVTISNNKNIVNKGDPAKQGWTNINVDLQEFMQIVKNGFAWGNVLKNPNHNKKPNAQDIQESYLIGIDIDNERKEYDKLNKKKITHKLTESEGYLSIQQAENDEFIKNFAWLIYTSPSHSHQHHKFRIVFKLESTISNKVDYEQLLIAMIHKFNSDPSCKNFDRMFFGNTNAEFVIFDKILSNHQIYELMKPTLNDKLEQTNNNDNIDDNNTNHANIDYNIVQNMLSFIPPQMAYDDWFKVVSGVANHLSHNEAVSLISNWSPAMNKQGIDITDTKIKQAGKDISIGTVVRYAKENGFQTYKLFGNNNLHNGHNKHAKILTDSHINSNGKPIIAKQIKLPDNIIFWEEVPSGKSEPAFKLKINKATFLKYLEYYGFAKYWVDKSLSIFVRVQDNVVQEVNVEIIIDFVKNDIMALPLEITPNFTKFDLWEMIIAKINTYNNNDLLKTINPISKDFLVDDANNCYIFFKSNVVQIDKNNIQIIKYKDVNKLIWQEQIIDFELNKIDDAQIHDMLISQFGQFISKICSPANKEFPEDKQKREIDAKRFAALCSSIGYLIYTYKDPTLTKAIVFCEEKIANDDEANGRSGKGLTANAIARIRKRVIFNGKQIDFNDKFLFQKLNPDTQIIYFDDIKKSFDFEALFSVLTEGITIEKKGQKPIDVPFAKSPKILISTNNVLANDTDSHKARKFEIEFTDYFTADYTPIDEFGNGFFETGWDENSQEWNRFYHFMIACVQLFLIKGLIGYSQVNLEMRKLKAQVPEEFLEFIPDIIDTLTSGGKIYINELHEEFIKKHKIYGEHGKYALSSKKTTRWFNLYLKHFKIDAEVDRDSTRGDRKRFWALKSAEAF